MKVMQLLGAIALFGVVEASMASDNPTLVTPEGFGVGTTGGAGGEVIRVTTAAQLQKELCRTIGAGGVCSDNAPRVIEVAKTLDFTGSEKKASGLGCDYGATTCSAPYKTETLVLLDASDTHCSGKTIRKITYDKAGNNPMLVGSNKTLVGIGSAGVIKGKGLRLMGGVKNVIIRNLTISDINQGIIFAGDAITLDNTDHVWIDHNRFQRIGRHMITGGFGATTNITISWNDFDGNNIYSSSSGCNGHHYWNMMLAGDSQSITFANNWFHEFHGRAPKINGKSGMIHLVNNYFQNGSWHALDSHLPLNFLIEGNYFQNVSVPIITGTGSGYIFGVLGGPSADMQAQCKSTLGRNCYGNVAKSASSTNGFGGDSTVMNAFKSVAKSAITTPYTGSKVPATVKVGAGPGKI